MGFDKLAAPLGGITVLERTLAAFECAGSIQAVVLVGSSDARIATLVALVPGGPRRQDPGRAGLEVIAPAEYDVVAVHDGPRPLVDPATIDNGVRLARERGAAVAAVRVVDTTKRVAPDRRVVETLPRDQLWSIQTPQVFRTQLLCRAHATITVDVTDDAAMVELLGEPVWVYPGARRNLKITTPEDLAIAEALLRYA